MVPGGALSGQQGSDLLGQPGSLVEKGKPYIKFFWPWSWGKQVPQVMRLSGERRQLVLMLLRQEVAWPQAVANEVELGMFQGYIPHPHPF